MDVKAPNPVWDPNNPPWLPGTMKLALETAAIKAANASMFGSPLPLCPNRFDRMAGFGHPKDDQVVTNALGQQNAQVAKEFLFEPNALLETGMFFF